MRRQIPSWLFAGLAVLLGVRGAAGQGAFQNLGFESGNIPPATPISSLVSTNAGLPGWTVYLFQPAFGVEPLPQVVYDGTSTGGAFVAINDAKTGFGFAPLQGTFSAVLYAGGGPSDQSATISQTGLVPAGTMSLRAFMQWSLVAPIVMLGGQNINMVPLQTFPNYTLYGGDISAFAGQVVALSFTEPPPAPAVASELILDNIVFSTQGVPEPSFFALSALGALLLGVRVLGRRR
jgi:hypothetical protein